MITMRLLFFASGCTDCVLEETKSLPFITSSDANPSPLINVVTRVGSTTFGVVYPRLVEFGCALW